MKKIRTISLYFTKAKFYIQFFCLLILNSDFAAFIKGLKLHKGRISDISTKKFCSPGLNCYSCPSATTSCPIGALQFWLNDTAEKIKMGGEPNLSGLYILGLMGSIGALCGRLPCGWICPFGFIQDLLNKITKKNKPIANFFKYFKYFVLAICVIIIPSLAIDGLLLSPWFCKLICPAGTLGAGLPLLAMDSDLRSMIGIFTIIKIVILIFVLIMCLIHKRFFCKVLCPLGAFWGLWNKVSVIRLKYDITACVHCKRCEDVCPMHIKITKNVNSAECIRCLECVKVCPAKAIDMNSSILINKWIDIYKIKRKARAEKMSKKLHQKMTRRKNIK